MRTNYEISGETIFFAHVLLLVDWLSKHIVGTPVPNYFGAVTAHQKSVLNGLLHSYDYYLITYSNKNLLVTVAYKTRNFLSGKKMNDL